MTRAEPRPGTRAARVLERLRQGPIHLHRDADRLRATPGQLLRSIAALRESFDMNIGLATRATYELRAGRYSERGYWGRQRGPVSTAVLDLLRDHGELNGRALVDRSGHPRRKIRSALVNLLRAGLVARVGYNRFALVQRDQEERANGDLQAKAG